MNQGIKYNGIIIDSTIEKNKLNKFTISNQGEVNIDIKAPDNNGISYNQYRRFNTNKGVTVQLNNDANQNKNMLAQGTQSAKLIINQINSSEKTNLHGLLNIKGSPAKVIIANPNGITCDDCQFSNTTGVDLVAGKMNYTNNTINYQTDKGKIIFTGLGIWGNGGSSINEKNKFLSNLAVYAGKVRFNNGAKVNVAKQYYTIGNVETEIDACHYGNRKILGLAEEKTTFSLAKNSQIYANQLRIFTSKGTYLNNKGTIAVAANKWDIGNMSIKAERISNKHTIAAYGAIEDDEYTIPSTINITTKHLINHQDSGIEASEGSVTLETYKGNGYFNKNIKQYFHKVN
ncbi:filamentous hemagglutinin N-terminal domain-containing protein [Candidatus Arsenophonus nilaparvatae]|uniref:two-partner secretion domain-containing protein n=1 Tax=Candidatus Arsenophonus nilaparvatae TaxID=1247023 RepID=UPI0009E01FDE